MIGDVYRLLLLPHLQVHNANAMSSPFTVGFPAMTAWLGAIHALQRKLIASGLKDVELKKVAVISHNADLQVKKGPGDYVYSIIGTGNPVDKEGERSSFIEEARCHLDVSLIVEYEGIKKDQENEFIEKVKHVLSSNMKMAGGDVLSFKNPALLRVEDGVDSDLHKLIRRLMPGYAVVERRELMIEAMEQGEDSIDALLDYLAVHHSCEQDEAGNVKWTSKRRTSGWIVPIATGFQGLTELGRAKNQRDPDAPHRFAESLVTLGEFRMAHRIQSLDEIFWMYHTDLENNMYLCAQYCEQF